MKGALTMFRTIFAAFVFLGNMCTLLVADEVYLVNGDRISGKVQTLLDGKLTIESALAGKIVIDINNIATFKTDEPVEVRLKDGTSFKQQIEKAEAGKFAVKGGETLKAQDFNVALIAAVNPPPKEEPKWHGEISGAVISTHGNTKNLSESVSAAVTKRGENDRTLLSFDYYYAKQRDENTGEMEKTQDQWKARGKYDYFFSKKLYGFIDTRYERDAIAELQRRVLIGAGGGYQWVESEPFNFSTDAGIATRYESYYNDTESSSQVTAQLGYHLDKKLNKTLTFINDLTYYPAFEKFSDYYLTTTAELRAKVTELIFTNFKVVFDYDVTPAEGKGSTDVKYILGVGVTF
jgi:putative salt-induced outer membrane protein YdiY